MSKPKIVSIDSGWRPAQYALFSHKAGKSPQRIGGFESLEKARLHIKNMESIRKDTFSGLFAPNTEVVEYSIWESNGWTKL